MKQRIMEIDSVQLKNLLNIILKMYKTRLKEIGGAKVDLELESATIGGRISHIQNMLRKISGLP